MGDPLVPVTRSKSSESRLFSSPALAPRPDNVKNAGPALQEDMILLSDSDAEVSPTFSEAWKSLGFRTIEIPEAAVRHPSNRNYTKSEERRAKRKSVCRF